MRPDGRQAANRWCLLVLAVVVSGGCDEKQAGGPESAGSALRRDAAGVDPSAVSLPSSLGGPDSGSREGELLIQLRPRLQPQPGMSVAVQLTGQRAAALTAFVIAPRWAGTAGPRNVQNLVVVDAQGNVGVKEEAATGRYALTRGPVGGRVRASYFAAAPEGANRFDLYVSSSGAWGVGHSFLVLPELDDELPVHLAWDLSEYGSATAASSLGVGADVVARARPADVAHSVFLAGSLLVREGGFGERLLVLGRPAFQASEALRLCSDALHRARAIFEPTDREPFTFAFVAQPHVGGDHDGASLFQSFVLWFDDSRGLDGRLKILAAHEVVHRWIGRKLRLSWPDGTDATWFSEGFAAHYARTLLFRHKMIEPDAFVEDLNRSYDVQRRATRAGDGAASRRPATEERRAAAPAYPLPVDNAVRRTAAAQRGALYAGRLDAQLRRKRRGHLDELVAELMERAKQVSGHALPVAAWRELLGERLGPGAQREFEQIIVQRTKPADVPFDALGECLVRTVVKDGAYELGFDKRSLQGERPVIQGLVSGSAAEAAGIEEGDVVVSGHETVRLGDANRTITLVVSGRRGTRLVRFNPQSTKPRVRWQVVHSCR